MAPILGYWKIRGYCQRIRLLLEYTGEKYEEKIYTFGPAPDFDRSQWLKDKFNLGLSFPNLPYYIDGDVKIAQSSAIIRYIARKHKLDGQTEEERIRIDIFEHQLYDLHTAWAQLCYNPNFEKLKVDYLEKLPDVIKQISEFLGKRKYSVGNNVTFVDFIAYEFLSQQQALQPDCIDAFPNLKEFQAKIEALPKVGDYIKTSPTFKYPINGAMALFSNS